MSNTFYILLLVCGKGFITQAQLIFNATNGALSLTSSSSSSSSSIRIEGQRYIINFKDSKKNLSLESSA